MPERKDMVFIFCSRSANCIFYLKSRRQRAAGILVSFRRKREYALLLLFVHDFGVNHAVVFLFFGLGLFGSGLLAGLTFVGLGFGGSGLIQLRRDGLPDFVGLLAAGFDGGGGAP